MVVEASKITDAASPFTSNNSASTTADAAYPLILTASKFFSIKCHRYFRRRARNARDGARDGTEGKRNITNGTEAARTEKDGSNRERYGSKGERDKGEGWVTRG